MAQAQTTIEDEADRITKQLHEQRKQRHREAIRAEADA